ncbi:MAG TPA: VOC family protein [Dehalococcoidia bacterium]|nr:VOC family protein [Dehalococcoidia bacterium]
MNATQTHTGVRRVTAYLCAKGAAEAIQFYTRAFGATERYRLEMPDGRIGHAEIVIGDTLLMLSDEAPELGVFSPRSLGGNSTSFVFDVDDADAAFQRALDAGATVERPLQDEPYGRGGWVVDPFGHRWSIMTPNPDFEPVQMK